MSWLVTTLIGLVLFVLFAWVARRLLGVQRLSTARTVLAAVGGLLIGEFLAVLLWRRDLDRDTALLAGVVLGLLFTMVFIIAFEALANPRRARRGSSALSNPVGAARRQVASGRRSVELAQIASRNNLGKGFGLAIGGTMTPEEAAEYGSDLRAAFEEAGGLFVKLGQLLASRPDLIPPETADELAGLQQDVAPAPRADVEPFLEAALDSPLDVVFAEFDWDPIGAGSLGQVYRARLVAGAPVVVKVRRPDIEEIVNRDLELILDLVRFAEQRSDEAQAFGIGEIAEQFAEQLKAEMDYTIEARNTIEIGRQVEDHELVSVPTGYEDLSSRPTLILGFVEGAPLGRIGEVGGERGRRLADVLFTQEVGAMLAGQRFHADPHPGNVMIRPDGGLGLIDFGSTGRLDAFERAAVTDILTALAMNDPSMLRAAALQVGMEARDVDPAQLDRAFARLMADHLGEGAEPSVELLSDFVEITTRFELRMPPNVTEMMRAVVTLQGTLELLSPGYPLIDSARALASDAFAEALSPENLAEQAKIEAIRVAPLLRRIPHHVDRIAGQIEQGTLSVRISALSNEDDVRVLTRLVNRGVLAFIGAALGVVSVMLLQVTSDFQLTDNIGLLDVLGFVGLFSGAILIMRVVLETQQDR